MCYSPFFFDFRWTYRVKVPNLTFSGKEPKMNSVVAANITALVVWMMSGTGEIEPVSVKYPLGLRNHLKLKNHITIKKMRQESNRIRQEAGKPEQELDEELCKAAQGHAEYMAEQGNMSHYINGTPSSRAKDAGWKGGFVTENIARGQRSIKSVFSVWRNSSGHYANMTGRYDRCGFGMARRGNMIYWCAVYARSIPKLDKKK